MEVKIGVQNAPRELVLDIDTSQEEFEKTVTAAVQSDSVLPLTDTKGRRVLVPASKIAYVEIGREVTGAVGFHL
ncbi:DUF3107 domain-containing protein [Nocardioides massiliensis]|uniref:ATP-binding protein n=1 Tax=Nocardioides massiliensis TaxID=1325935 RepID=A0ABT9NVE4_9ACTN|nr:DUF3107 domain-containing protein [Nocardioides massiliensis]MDP9824129.1 hypothetical protein [Nocardioides massiliensis]